MKSENETRTDRHRDDDGEREIYIKRKWSEKRDETRNSRQCKDLCGRMCGYKFGMDAMLIISRIRKLKNTIHSLRQKNFLTV